MRRLQPWLLASALVVFAGCALLPTGPSDALKTEVVGPHGIEGYRSAHAIFYVIPLAEGVIVVDTGMDDDGRVLLPAVGQRKVLAILLTHAHRDHWTGAHLFGDVPTYVHAADRARIDGDDLNQGWLNHLIDRVVPRPTPPQHLVEIEDGAMLEIGGEQIRAVSVPGHTPGSVVYLFRDILLGGDAVMGGEDGLGIAPDAFSDDSALAAKSVARVRGLGAKVLLDGHGGRTDDFDAALERYLEAETLAPEADGAGGASDAKRAQAGASR